MNFNWPHTPHEFNLAYSGGKIDFWGDMMYGMDSISHRVYRKGNLIWLVFEVKQYYVLAKFENSGFTKEDYLSGDLREVIAIDNISDFIEANEPSFYKRNFESDFVVPEAFSEKRQFKRYTNVLYVDRDYHEMIKLLSEFLLNDFGLYALDDNDRTITDKGLYELWSSGRFDRVGNDVSCCETLYFFSGEVNYNVSGVGIKTTHQQRALLESMYCYNDEELRGPFKTALDEKNLENSHIDSPIPKIISSKCKNIPNVIEISFPFAWKYPEAGNLLMFGLAKKFGEDAYMVSSDYNIMCLKANPFLSEEEKLQYLYEYTNDYLGSENLEGASKAVKEIIGEVWNELHENSKTFLATGHFLYERTIAGSIHLLDFSLPSLAFAKCIENELVHRVVIPYKEHYKTFFAERDLSFDLKDSNLVRMAQFLSREDKTPPELGSFSYFLQNVINSKKRAKRSVSIQAFKSFVDTLEQPDFILEQDKMHKTLNLIAKKYRNGSAHIKVLPIEYLKEFNQLLFDGKFLEQFVIATKLGNQQKTI